LNRIQQLFQQKQDPILNIFFTAGYPERSSTREIIRELDKNGVDMLEIGIPFSDPLADGPTIQGSSQQALKNGMTLEVLMEQLKGIRQETDMPLLLMGYLNPVVQYGLERFLEDCAAVGIDGLILPDLPMYEYENMYRPLFQKHGLSNVFLVTPETSEERIRKIDELTEGFIYLVSSSSTTGKTTDLSASQEAYFQRVKDMQLKHPCLIGFGIKDAQSFQRASQHARGAIIGSAFIKALAEPGELEEKVATFVKKLRGREN
jgi:tryptophan synthase alpha chain